MITLLYFLDYFIFVFWILIATILKMSRSKPKRDSTKKIKVGERVLWFGDREKATKGTIRWLGKIEAISDGTVAGVELTKALGANDGSWNHKQYFNCPSKHGLFIDVDGLLRESDVGDISSESEDEIKPTPKANKVSFENDSDETYEEEKEDGDNEIAKKLLKDLETAINTGSEKMATQCVTFLINSKIKCQIKLSSKPHYAKPPNPKLTKSKQEKEIEMEVTVEKNENEEKKYTIPVSETISIIDFKIKIAKLAHVEPYALKMFCGDMKSMLKDNEILKKLNHKNKFIAVVTSEK